MADDLQEFQGNSEGMAQEDSAKQEAGGSSGETNPPDITKDPRYQQGMSKLQTQASEATRRAASLEQENALLRQRMSTIEQAIVQINPDAAQTLGDVFEKAELRTKAEMYDAMQQQQAQYQQWQNAAQGMVAAAGFDPFSAEGQAAIVEAAQAGEQAYAVLTRKVAEMVTRKAAPPKPEPQQRQVPSTDYAVPPAGGAPPVKVDKDALEIEFLKLSKDWTKNKVRLDQISKLLNE